MRFRVAWGCKIHDAAELVLVIDTERNICELVWLSLASINFYILSRLAILKKNHSNLPVIIMPGDINNKPEAAALAVNGLSQKPFFLSDVENRIQQILQIEH